MPSVLVLTNRAAFRDVCFLYDETRLDDHEDLAGAAARVVRTAGWKIGVALDPDGAAQSSQSRSPDPAMLDVVFPQDVSAGFELARRMHRDRGKLKDVPILMPTAVDRKFPLELGAADVDGDSPPVAEHPERTMDAFGEEDGSTAVSVLPRSAAGTELVDMAAAALAAK